MVDISTATNAQLIRQAHVYDDRMAGSVPVWKGQDSGVKANDLAHSLNATEINASNGTPPSFSFGELLDIINPLHHIPIVSNIYRNMTGDEISPVARIAGGALFGGAIGGVTSLAAAAIQEHRATATAYAKTENTENIQTAKISVEDIQWNEVA
jgi:hypothetical protein